MDNNLIHVDRGTDDTVIVNGEVCYRHYIKLSEYINTQILIPKQLDGIKFKAITKMANDLFKMNSITGFNSDEESMIDTGDRRIIHWTNETINQLKQYCADGLTATEIANKMGVKRARVWSKIYLLGLDVKGGTPGLKKKTVAHSNREGTGTGPFSKMQKNEIEKIIEEWDGLAYNTDGKTQMAESYGLSKNRMRDQLKYYRDKFNIKSVGLPNKELKEGQEYILSTKTMSDEALRRVVKEYENVIQHGTKNDKEQFCIKYGKTWAQIKFTIKYIRQKLEM